MARPRRPLPHQPSPAHYMRPADSDLTLTGEAWPKGIYAGQGAAEGRIGALSSGEFPWYKTPKRPEVSAFQAPLQHRPGEMSEAGAAFRRSIEP